MKQDTNHGVDWRAIRVARVEKKLRFYSRVLHVCRERFKENKLRGNHGSDNTNMP